jgi:hypothetical protein
MHALIEENRRTAAEETSDGIPLTRAELVSALRMFINTFGVQPLHEHPDLRCHGFHYLPNLLWWEMAIALQIAVDTTAACGEEDKRVVRLKKHFRELLGPCKHETLVRIQNYPFVVERPSAPF